MRKLFRKCLLCVCLLLGLTIIMPVHLQAVPKVNTPKLKSVKGIDYNSIKITWKRSKNATGYLIYRDNRKLATVIGGKRTTFTDKKIQFGKGYKYSVKAYQVYKKKYVYSQNSKSITGKACLKTPQLSKIKYWNSGAPYATGVQYGTIWKKVSGAEGYQVEIKEFGWKGSTGSSSYRYTRNTKASIQFSDVYKFGIRARAYRMVNGTRVYGAYSKWVWKTMY